MMTLIRFQKTGLQTIFLLILLSIAFFFKKNNPNPVIQINKQDAATNIRSNSLRIMSIGNRRLISSILYTFTFLEADIDHYKGEPLNNWMFLRFKTIMELDDRFDVAAHWGGMYLSIIKDDPISASIIFEMGLKHYPNHFWLNYWAGYNYYLELKRPKEALVHYMRILGMPEMYQFAALLPSIVADITNKIEHGENENLHVQELLQSVIHDSKMPEYIKERVEYKLLQKKEGLKSPSSLAR